ncbi:MAG: hypothetical protein ACREHC_08265 [Candidatus Levyibacteriota bacterium]
MGRFDALSNLEDTPVKKMPPLVVSSPTPKPSPPQPQIEPIEVTKKTEIMKTRKPEMKSPTLATSDKPEKYSTLIEANLIKKIKIFAAEKDIKDYQVIALALTEYFDKNK